MNNFRLVLSSPYGNIFDGYAQKLTLRGVEGDLAVLAGHVPMITEVKPGRTRLPVSRITMILPLPWRTARKNRQIRTGGFLRFRLNVLQLRQEK